jgi:2-methylcitrate dehydratase PrpD
VEYPEALTAARSSSFDCVGCIGGGGTHGRKIVSFAQDEGGAGESTVLGTGVRTSRSMAALANGALAY